MGNFDYATRRELSNKFKLQMKERIAGISKKNQGLAKDILEMRNYSYKGLEEYAKVENDFAGGKWKTPAEMINSEFKDVMDAFVPGDLQQEYLYIIDKLNKFPFSRGYNRRTMRSQQYLPVLESVFKIMNGYSNFFFFGGNVEKRIRLDYDEEMADFACEAYGMDSNMGDITAAAIDMGDKGVISTIREAIESENNNVLVTRWMIEGIVKSDNMELHKLLGDLLLAARLQEGLRQAICEAMDEGTSESFLTLLEVIEKNNLIRYSSVKRAVSTWIGICDEANIDRVNSKMLALMGECLRDETALKKYLASEDSIELSIALWATGFYEVLNAVAEISKIVDGGTKNQRLTASLYNSTLQSGFASKNAKKVIREKSDDLQLVACYIREYIPNVSKEIDRLLTGSDSYYIPDNVQKPKKCDLKEYFADKSEAEGDFEILLRIYDSLQKKELVYSPIIFPWYSVTLKKTDIVEILCLIAYMLEDEEKIDLMAGKISDISGGSWSRSRSNVLHLLLFEPKNEHQRKALIDALGNAEEYTSNMAFKILKNLKLESEDYAQMRDLLRLKREKIRTSLLDILMQQNDADIVACISELIADKKEEKRTAGLDMIMQLSNDSKRKSAFESVKNLPATIQKPTSKEKVLIEELSGETSESSKVLDTEGFGIYDPDEKMKIAFDSKKNKKASVVYDELFPLSEKELIKLAKELDKLVAANKDYEYTAAYGETVLLGNSFTPVTYRRDNVESELERYPLCEVWQKFYEQKINSPAVMSQLKQFSRLPNAEDTDEQKKGIDAVIKMMNKIFGKFPYELPCKLLNKELAYPQQVAGIISEMFADYVDREVRFEQSIDMMSLVIPELDENNKTISYYFKNSFTKETVEKKKSIFRTWFFSTYESGVSLWKTDEEFVKAFNIAVAVCEICGNDETVKVKRYYRENGNTLLCDISWRWFLKAFELGMISENMLYKSAFEFFELNNTITAVSLLQNRDNLSTRNAWPVRSAFGEEFWKLCKNDWDSLVKNNKAFATAKKMYQRIVPTILGVELKRGDTPNALSEPASHIKYLEGIDYLIKILQALGKDTLDRSTYYYWGSNSKPTKKENLSRLLKACYPAGDDDEKKLKAALKGTDIKDTRLVEVAMYAPQWIDIIEKYLGWNGLKSGCYYFMAHMNEAFDERKEAIIAKYTPLSAEELQNGAFDINWFKEAYKALGEKNFGELYNAAKYISDGIRHSRARKYADAASGKLKLADMKKEIESKRNKDLLMAYALVPLKKGDKDIVSRYEFFQKFKKESRQFGSQRQASEGKAVEMALSNLSMNAGYSDVTRLTLNMETKLMKQMAGYMKWKDVDDIKVRIAVDEYGKSAIEYMKGEKALKTLPAKLKKNAYILEIKDINKKLKNQYSRTKKLMEESMENSVAFKADEIIMLYENSIAEAILKDLVFKCDEKFGFAVVDADAEAGTKETKKGYLLSADGEMTELQGEEDLIIAHPFHLFKAGVWHEYQQYLFEKRIKQPFKQVFRELYVKLAEEKDQLYSRMFAGNQIQPKRTVGALKTRKWIADYEEGLQKIYYKENIVARIYALADWFSPSEVEEPTLEYVEFSNRKTFETVKIKDVPDIIYSEVMRDVDLAVSVAHAGGVDPETSHSTIEMRAAIVEFNLPLFKLDNVRVEGSHAFIKGKLGSYTVHLGSGVIHQEGGTMINVLPVHSQNRGKLFLPFIDEDPKTAEIMSKIVFFAEDNKIKDPFILNQIH